MWEHALEPCTPAAMQGFLHVSGLSKGRVAQLRCRRAAREPWKSGGDRRAGGRAGRTVEHAHLAVCAATGEAVVSNAADDVVLVHDAGAHLPAAAGGGGQRQKGSSEHPTAQAERRALATSAGAGTSLSHRPIRYCLNRVDP